MPAKKQANAAKRTQLKWAYRDGTPTFYTNNIEIRVSNADVMFRIGEISGRVEESGEMEVYERARLFMTLEHARSLLRVLSESMRKVTQDDEDVVAVE